MGTERKTVDYWEKRYEKSKESIPLLNSLCTELKYSTGTRRRTQSNFGSRSEKAV